MRGECRVYSGVPVVTNSCAYYHLHTRLRVHWAPGIPCALCLSRGIVLQNLGRLAPRERGCISSRLFENRINLVVPDKRAQRARSGTHNHQCSLLGQSWGHSERINRHWWLWVPAFAGTTLRHYAFARHVGSQLCMFTNPQRDHCPHRKGRDHEHRCEKAAGGACVFRKM